MTDPRDEGGDAVCWIERVCDRCGAIVEPGHACAALARLDGVQAGAGPGGVVWALGGPRQLEANLVVLGAGESIPQHRNDDVDVLVVVVAGAGRVTVDRTTDQVGVHDLMLIPAGTIRRIAAGDEGIRYLSIHRARAGPTVQARRVPST